MAGPKTLHPDFVAFVELLNAHDVAFHERHQDLAALDNLDG
ncbi:hypothetical protein [Longimonas halophila]|nr:hypothetical protein [Longimonas halophila]